MGIQIHKDEIPEFKQWAIDIDNQIDFEREFMRRNPRADVIPDRIKWISAEVMKKRGIDAFNPELMEIDGKNEVEIEKTDNLTCRGCKKSFTAQIGRIAHERRCEDFLKKGINNG